MNIYLFIVPLVKDPQWGYIYAVIVMLSSLILYFLFVHKKYVLPGIGEFHNAVNIYINTVF